MSEGGRAGGRWRRLPRALSETWQLARRVAEEMSADRIPGLAAEAAFFTLLSVPPLLLAVLGTIGFFAERFEPDTLQQIERLMLSVPARFLTPETMSQLVSPGVGRIVREGSGSVVSIGLVVALWAGSAATNAYIQAITLAWDIEDPRPLWRRRLMAFAVTLVGSVLAIFVLPTLAVGPRVLSVATPDPLRPTVDAVLSVGFWPTMLLFSVFLLTTLYHLSIPEHTPWRRDLPGALLALGMWLVGSYGLRLYVRARQPIYGPLTAPLVALAWVYVTALAVLVGAEVNSEIERRWPSVHMDCRPSAADEDLEAKDEGLDTVEDAGCEPAEDDDEELVLESEISGPSSVSS